MCRKIRNIFCSWLLIITLAVGGIVGSFRQVQAEPISMGIAVGTVVWNAFAAAGLTIGFGALLADILFNEDRYSVDAFLRDGCLVQGDAAEGDYANYNWDGVYNRIEEDASAGNSDFAKVVKDVFGKVSDAADGWKQSLKDVLIDFGLCGDTDTAAVADVSALTNALQDWSVQQTKYNLTVDQMCDPVLAGALSTVSSEYSNFTLGFYLTYKDVDASSYYHIFLYDPSVCSVAVYGTLNSGYSYARRIFNSDSIFLNFTNLFQGNVGSYSFKTFSVSEGISVVSALTTSRVARVSDIGPVPHFPDKASAIAYLEALPAPYPTYSSNLINGEGHMDGDSRIKANVGTGKAWKLADKPAIENYINKQNNNDDEDNVVANYTDFVNNHVVNVTNPTPDPEPDPDLTPVPSPGVDPNPDPDLTPVPSPGVDPNPDPDLTPVPSPGVNPDPDPNVTPVPSVIPPISPGPSDTPDPPPEEDIGSYSVDLRRIFPFCIPFDLIHLLDALDAEPRAPCFEIPLEFQLTNPWTGQYVVNYKETFELDFADFEPVVKIFRIFQVIFFLLGLLLITRSQMIKG